MLLTFIPYFTDTLLWNKISALSNLSSWKKTAWQYKKADTRQFVDGQSAISPFLGGWLEALQSEQKTKKQTNKQTKKWLGCWPSAA